MNRLSTLFLAGAWIMASVVSYAQSEESFYTISLQDEVTGNTLSLSPASLTSSYRIIFPASLPTSGPQNFGLSLNRSTQAMSFAVVPQLNLASRQVAYLDPDGITLRGSSGLMWDTTTQQLQISTTGTSSAISVSRSPATTNPIAIFTGGNVGVNITAPQTALDVDGDFAIRELSYTSAIGSVSNPNFDFGNTNRAGNVRLATALTAGRTFTGFVGGRNGKKLDILNVSGQVITLANESNLSIDTNRIRTATDDNLDLPSGASISLLYSNAEKRWRVTSMSPVIVQAFTKFADVVAAGDTEIPANAASYIKVSNASGNRNVTLPNGLVIGQILVIQNLGPDRITITGTNIEVTPPSDKLDKGDAAFFVWDGAKWQLIARKQ